MNQLSFSIFLKSISKFFNSLSWLKTSLSIILFIDISSIDKFIGKDYSRVRIGIGKPKGNIDTADFVLQNFDEDETVGIEKILENITESISILVEKKLDLFSSTVNNK